MSTDHRNALAKIKRFDQLIAYLRDEMGWPIARDSFEDVDDLFYDFTAAELGIDPKTAAKIESIKRLRPLSPKQPWGIFFVKFEPKNLPVVALRRILSQVALKKRASANSADRAAWAADDLLFISNYGEGDERQITFAHFSEAQDGHDLPTLKVLGWDNLDTALHLDAVAKELTQHLSWPDDDADVDAWRKSWRAAFNLRHREVVTTSRDLSIRLAELARAIRDRIKSALAIESETGPLTKLMKAFREALVHDLDADGFADMYAQTIAYGLLSARIANPEKKTADDFAAHMRTNPFLRELMETFLKVGGRRGKAGGPGIDFDELGVSEVVELLDDAKMEAVVRDFGDRNPQEDPVIHFYELFLKEYDPKERMQRGVFYTPRPVVSYIVRSVDELLRTEFGLEDGLASTATWGDMAAKYADLKIPDGTEPADPFVVILDPATGTATFLVEVIDMIHRTLAASWEHQGLTEPQQHVAWNAYVPKHLLPRLHGYELLMAPYAIAHMKIGLKLYETGYRFGSDERARIYLTNALEPPSDEKEQREFEDWVPALAHEAKAVNAIKRHQRFTVVVGNPPYSGISANLADDIRRIIDPYRFVDGVPIQEKSALQFEKNLNDDYVKFFRLAEMQLEGDIGILGLITNNGFQASATLRGMRNHLLQTFGARWLVDLHGDADKRERDELGRTDENVFEIKRGVCIAMLVRSSQPSAADPIIHRWDIRGSAAHKYNWLRTHSVCSTSFQRFSAKAPQYFFFAIDEVIGAEYEQGISTLGLLGVNSTGFESGRDEILTDFTAEELRTKLKHFATASGTEVRSTYSVQEAWGKKLFDERASIVGETKFERHITPFLFGPLDFRYCFYRKDLLKTNSHSAGKHLLAGTNLALMVMRQVSMDGVFSHVGVTRVIPNNRCFYSTKGKISYFPLWLFAMDRELALSKNRRLGSNFKLGALFQIRNKLPTTPGSSKPSELDIFYYTYGVLHSPGYRSRYAEFLKSDFPRIPLTGNLELFHALVDLGGELVALHVLELPALDHFITHYTGPKNPEVGRVGWSNDSVWLDAATTKKGQPAEQGSVGFRGVPEAVWNFHIGGYQVCEKWLKDRKGRTLSKDDIVHYQKIVVALAETIRLMKETDEAIQAHGGWPAAFASGPIAASTGAAKDDRLPDEVIPIRGEASPQIERYEREAPRLREVAEPAAPAYSLELPADASDGINARSEEPDREELICQVRQLFIDGHAREREAAISEIARGLGYQRTGPRIHEVLDDTIRTAVRRGILENVGGTLRLGAKSIEQFERDFLKEQFVASLGGPVWINREEAIRAFARWLGFRRTGPAIDETARSLVNGLIRTGRIESEGAQIRKAR